MSYSDDIAAIDFYITYGPASNKGRWPRTEEAEKVGDEWREFHENISFWDDDQETYDKARNIRNKFNDANAVTAEEKKAASEVKKKGLTTEELEGGTRRTTASGDYIEQFNLLSAKTKATLMITAILGAIAYVGFKLSPLAKLAKMAK